MTDVDYCTKDKPSTCHAMRHSANGRPLRLDCGVQYYCTYLRQDQEQGPSPTLSMVRLARSSGLVASHLLLYFSEASV